MGGRGMLSAGNQLIALKCQDPTALCLPLPLTLFAFSPAQEIQLASPFPLHWQGSCRSAQRDKYVQCEQHASPQASTRDPRVLDKYKHHVFHHWAKLHWHRFCPVSNPKTRRMWTCWSESKEGSQRCSEGWSPSPIKTE